MKKRLLATLLTVCMVISMVPAAFAAGDVFTDVDTEDWFAESVRYVYDKGLMNGTGGNSFTPNGTVTRAMVWTTLARLAGENTAGSDPWWQVGQQWVVRNKISDGTMPEQDITREQLVTMFYRYAQYAGADVGVAESTNILSYKDAVNVNEWAIPAMQWACGAGIINGVGDMLQPRGSATRAQLAAILHRFTKQGIIEPKDDVYTVTFMYNYGTKGVYKEVSVEAGKTVGNPGIPSRGGYSFVGWYTDAASTERFDLNTVITADVVLYAKWTEMIPAHLHRYDNWVANGDGTHTGTCSCGADYTEDCVLDANHICTKCGRAYPQSASDLQAALNAGGYVKLPEDIAVDVTLVIPENVSVTLDLNGKSITAAIPKADGSVIKNQGTLVITGGVVSSTAENGGSAIVNSGTLTVTGATLNGAPQAGDSWPSYTINNSGVLNLENSTITSSHGAVSSYGAGAVVTMNHTNIDMSGIPGFTSHGIYTYDGGRVTVNGGTIANKAGDQNSTGGSAINGDVEVNGAHVIGRLESYSGTPVINSGTFTVDPSRYVAEGSKVTDNGDGTWTVTALTVVDGVVYDGTVLHGLTDTFSGDTLTVRAGTTEIGPQALKNSTVRRVILPEGLEIIGYQAFSKTVNLTSVEIPSTVTTIGEQAFRLCGATEITVPAGVSEIGDGAFRDMPNLTTITFEGDNVVIPNYVCRSCTALTTVYLFGSNVTFGGTSMAFTHKDNGDANGITIYVANEEVASDLRTAQTSAYGYTVVVGREIAEGVIQHGDSKTFEVISKAGLMNLDGVLANAALSEGRGAVVNLADDIDLAGETWTPLNHMWVTFDGNGHTISNLTAGFDSTGRRSGFWGYAGAVTIQNLTLENVSVAGSQAGAFAGAVEGSTIQNCYLKGVNTVTFAPGIETYNGIGAITGVLTDTNSTVNVEIVQGTSVTLEKGNMTTEADCTYIDNLTGYFHENQGSVINHGTVIAKSAPTTAAALDAALKNGDHVLLSGNMSFSAQDTTANSGYGATGLEVSGGIFDGNGNTLTVTGANTTWDCAIYVEGGIIKNLTVGGAVRGIFMGKAVEDVYIDNVVFSDVIYTFNSDAGSKNFGVYISNSTLNGWTSFSDAHKEVVFSGCVFGAGRGYAYCRPYNTSVFENCVFQEGFVFDASETQNITFINCYYGDTLITAENAATLGTGSDLFFEEGVGGVTFQ